ncbi:MAG: hypothetical protein LUD46_14360 [Parabacteroides sp.]|nr:hypothetical protein [Parabacteroides sp.]
MILSGELHSQPDNQTRKQPTDASASRTNSRVNRQPFIRLVSQPTTPTLQRLIG